MTQGVGWAAYDNRGTWTSRAERVIVGCEPSLLYTMTIVLVIIHVWLGLKFRNRVIIKTSHTFFCDGLSGRRRSGLYESWNIMTSRLRMPFKSVIRQRWRRITVWLQKTCWRTSGEVRRRDWSEKVSDRRESLDSYAQPMGELRIRTYRWIGEIV